MNLKDDWFQGTDAEAFQIIAPHVRAYGVFPKAEALKGLQLPHAEEDAAYYLDKLVKFNIHSILAAGVQKAALSLNAQSDLDALKGLQEVVLAAMRVGAGNRIIDYAGDGLDLLMTHIDMQAKDMIKKVYTGWESLDQQTNGLAGGDVVSVIGRPANGKSFMLFWSALKVWEKDKVPLVFSMEMNHLAVTERLAAMQSGLGLSVIKKGVMATTPKDTKLMLTNALSANQGGQPFWLVDGAMSATVDDVVMYANHLKPDIVYIDGAYLLRAAGNLPRWERVTANMERLKGDVAEALGIPVMISYQFNRDAAKKMKKGESDEVGLEDIGYTDAVGQISSVVLGMLEDAGVKTHKRRQVRVLKGRDGQTKNFYIRWLFQAHTGLDFSECEEHDISQMTSL